MCWRGYLLLPCTAPAATPMSCMSTVSLYVSSLKDGDSCNELREGCYSVWEDCRRTLAAVGMSPGPSIALPVGALPPPKLMAAKDP